MSETPETDNPFIAVVGAKPKTARTSVTSATTTSPVRPAKPKATPSTPKQTARKPAAVQLGIQISEDHLQWLRKTAATNHWTQRTVVELALDALKEKLND